MKKNLFSCVIFIALFCLLFAFVSPFFIPKNNNTAAGIHEVEAKGFLAEPENSLDVVFLGDSEVFSTFIPLRIWENHGIASYNCSTPDQVMYQSYSFLQHVLERQAPKMVILEANALYREFTIADVISHTAEELFPYLRYHDRWKTMTGYDFTQNVEFTHLIRDKGYTYRTRAIPASTEGYMTPSDEIYPMPVLSTWYFNAIHSLCRERGIPLMVVSVPSPTNWDYYYHNGVVKLLEGLDVPYIDMNLMPQEIPIDWQTESYDGGDHLNYAGACKVTDYTGQMLWDTGLFTDKREDPVYSHWNEALKDFLNNLE